jgi:hypothetical protein
MDMDRSGVDMDRSGVDMDRSGVDMDRSGVDMDRSVAGRRWIGEEVGGSGNATEKKCH